ncbi:hypothetical protein BC940DRAFT_311071 [Gongronella butleri]|nr:hypothetical protein BC940DRAFT_311071 [Gongronella butleri]
MPNPKFTLFNWKEGDVFTDQDGKRHVYDWCGEELGEEAYNKLRVGDQVRLVLMDVEKSADGYRCWEKIYFTITKINYYTKDSVNIPRTYFGTAENTYRMDPEEKLRYVRTGDEISFQKNNIIEIPGWTTDTPLPQPNAKDVQRSIDYMDRKLYQ